MTEADSLPDGWLRLPLSQAISPRGEKAAPNDHPDAKFIGMDHVEAQTGQIIGSVPAKSMKSAAARFKAGDVLYGRLRPYLNKVTRPTFDGLASAEFIVFPDAGFIASSFLEYRLRSRDFVSFASHLNEGDRPRVDFAQIGDFLLNVPPLPEQHRIVAKIEELFSELDAGTASLTRARAQLKTYRQALLKAAFEGKLTAPWRAANPAKLESPETLLSRLRKERDARHAKALDDWQTALSEWRAGGEVGRKPGKPSRFEIEGNPEIPDDLAGHCSDCWPWLRMGDVGMVSGGLTKNPKRDKLPIKMRYLRVGNVYSDRLDLEEISEIGVLEEEQSNVRLVDGDLLVVEGNGSVDQIGRVAIWRNEVENVGHQNHLIRVRLTSGMLPRFFMSFLVSPLGRDLIIRQASSTSGLHTLSITKISGLPVPVPCAAEQAAVLEVLSAPISQIEHSLEEITTALTRITALRQSILKKAFSGQLVQQDPADEPASALLARLTETTPKPRRKTKP